MNTYKQWIELHTRSNTQLHDQGIVEFTDNNNSNIDLSTVIPSLRDLKANNVKILDTPHFVDHNSVDQLKNHYYELNEYKTKLDEFSHIYSFQITRAVHTEDIFTLKVGVMIRGVKK